MAKKKALHLAAGLEGGFLHCRGKLEELERLAERPAPLCKELEVADP
jgi:hypothetical protein